MLCFRACSSHFLQTKSADDHLENSKLQTTQNFGQSNALNMQTSYLKLVNNVLYAVLEDGDIFLKALARYVQHTASITAASDITSTQRNGLHRLLLIQSVTVQVPVCMHR